MGCTCGSGAVDGMQHEAGCATLGAEPDNDAEVRAVFVRLITFVAAAKASHDMKNDALQCIEVLQARLLP